MPRVSRRAAQGVPPYVHAGEGGNKLHIPMAVPQYMPVPHYARQTGQRVMSAPVSRTARAATGSGPVGTATGTAASLACPGVLPSPVPPRIESERHLSYSTPSTTSRITVTSNPERSATALRWSPPVPSSNTSFSQSVGLSESIILCLRKTPRWFSSSNNNHSIRIQGWKWRT